MKIIIPKSVYEKLDHYSEYIISNGITAENRAVEKVVHIITNIDILLENGTNGGSLCPYWKFSGSGRGYRMIKIKDKWTKTTVWCIAFEDIDEKTRIVRGIELESVLASTDEKRYPPYQMKLPLDEHRMTRIIRQVIREMLYA